jgi:putative MATE family efflux protein
VRWRLRPDDREILALAVPAFGSLVAEPLYVLVDTAVVGHLGTPQLGGLAVASSVLLTGYALCVFLAYGTTATVARLLGAGDEREAAHQAVQGMWLALLIGAVLVPAGLLGGGSMVRVLGATDEVAHHADVYLRISVLGAPALLLTLAGMGYLRGERDTRTPLVVAIGTNVLNLGLELLLIPGLGYGVGASAAATVIAQWVGALVYIARVLRPVRVLGVPIGPDWRSLRRLLRAARDLFVRTAALRGSFTLATAVAARLGPVDVSAHEVAFQVWFFLALALDAVAIAGQALIGRALGAGSADQARALGRRMLELGVGFGVACGVLIVLLRPVLPQLFSDDPAVVALSGFLLWFVAAMQPVNAIVFVLDGILIGAGDQGFLARAMVGAAIVFVVGAAAVIGFGLGIGWLWATLTAFMLARLAPLYRRFIHGTGLVCGRDTAAIASVSLRASDTP